MPIKQLFIHEIYWNPRCYGPWKAKLDTNYPHLNGQKLRLKLLWLLIVKLTWCFFKFIVFCISPWLTMLLHVDVHQSYTPIYSFHHLKPRPNSYNISYNIIQLWCSMKCCTRLATLLYRVVSCCILLYKVWLLSDKCCTIQHFFCFPGCCMMLYSFGHPMQLCCTLFYSRVSSRSNFPATFLCWLAVGKLKIIFFANGCVLAVFVLAVLFLMF